MDTTERKQAESEVSRLAAALDLAGEGIAVIDADGTMQYANPAFEAITGYPKEEILGQTEEEFFTRRVEGDSQYAEMRRALADENLWTGRLTRKRKDGHLGEEACTISAVRDEAGAVTHYVSVHRDVSLQTSLEQQLSKAQQLEAIGRLAAGVAHDFNNLLQVIMGCGEHLQFALPAASPESEHLAMILAAGERARELTRQLLAFSRQQMLEPRALHLNAVVSDLEAMLRTLLGEDITFATVLEPNLTQVEADPSQLEQVIMNLAVNARDAMPQGGRLTIKTARAVLSPKDVSRYSYAVTPGAYVKLEVRDTGHGMDDKTLSHVFEPFFTTKDSGKGTGLGLATVYGIVKQSGGYIWGESQLGRGTTFTVYLPQTSAPGQSVAPSAVGAATQHGTETVLVVDDEEAVVAIVSETLARSGYTVVQARSPGDALLTAEQHEDPIHLLITDVVMPSMNGRELSERLTASRPEMRTLYISGYDDTVIVSHGVLKDEVELLQKPFNASRLTLKVREMLDSADGQTQQHKDQGDFRNTLRELDRKG